MSEPDMKLGIYISIDIEGIGGIVHKDSTLPQGKDYQVSRKWMTEELNAAIRGARDAGVTFFLINDSHLDMRNLILDDLDDQGDVMVISGELKPHGQMQGIDKSFSAAFLLGYHAMVGTRAAIIDHSYFSSGVIQNIRLNGKTVGETALSASVAGCFGVPVILVTGDECVCREAEDVIPGVKTVCLKTGYTRRSGKTFTPATSRHLVSQGAKEAVKSLAGREQVKPVVQDTPITLEVDLAYTVMADLVEMVPKIERVAGRTVRLASDDYLEIYKALQVIVFLSMYFRS